MRLEEALKTYVSLTKLSLTAFITEDTHDVITQIFKPHERQNTDVLLKCTT